MLIESDAFSSTRPSSVPPGGIKICTNPPNEFVIDAEVVVSPSVLYNAQENLQFREDPIQTGTQVFEKRNDRHPYRVLYKTLCVILFLAIGGIVFSLIRYTQVSKSVDSQPSLQETEGNTDLESVAMVDPNRDPIAYKRDIEYILSSEVRDDFVINFFEGFQKEAIDWLVFEDLTLTSTKIRAMVESMNSNFTSGGLVPIFPLLQRYALIALFFGTNGELWSESPWTDMKNISECEFEFEGVGCDEEGQVTNLTLAFRKLRGRLPEDCGLLTNLESAVFSGNSLEGTIPSFIYKKLSNLESLDLSKNEFTSSISPDISKLTNLKFLNFDELKLTGQIPGDAMRSLSNLEKISITFAHKLSGDLMKYTENWPNLTKIDISHSGLIGTLPSTIGMNTKLEYMYLDGVPINVSTIPTEIGLITNLKEFYFDSMSEILERGTIPSEIGNCRELTDVYIDSQITGSIPTELGLLTKMSTLILGNRLKGTMPSEIGQLKKLTVLDIRYNQIEGTLPSELGNLRSLDRFAIQHNKFSGSIPSGICESESIRIDYDCTVDECQCCDIPCI